MTSICSEDLYHWMATNQENFIVIDLRIEDYLKGHIRQAYNIPTRGQLTQENLTKLVDTLSCKFTNNRNIIKVIFHCSASRNRGPRVANQFHEYCQRNNLTFKYQSCVLVNGFVGWEAYCQKHNCMSFIEK